MTLSSQTELPNSESASSLWTLEGVTVAGRLSEVSCVVPHGTTAVLGASGAGKTTLLNLLLGLEKPRAGIVRETLPEAELPVFFASSACGLWPDETVWSHVRLGCGEDAVTAEWLERLELTGRVDARPGELSQGERSRLSMARACAAGPAVLVLDEPLAHVDRRRARAASEILFETESDPRHLVLATHDPAEASKCEHTIVLEEGRLVAEGPTEQLRENPPCDAAAWALGLLSVFLLLLPGCQDAEATGVEPTRVTILPPVGATLPAPRAVSVGPDDERYVLDNAGRVLVYDADGTLVQQWAMPESDVGKPEGVRKLADGRIAVADTHYHRVVLFEADGAVSSMFGSRGEGPGQFIFPVSVEQDDEGFLYVAEYGGHDRVQKFTAGGEFVLEFGTTGTAHGEFQRPSGVVCRDGEVFVADAINNRIQVFSRDGELIRVLGEGSDRPLFWPYDLAAGPAGRLWVPEYGSGRVASLSAGGDFQEKERVPRYSRQGGGQGELSTPWGIAVDSRGTVIVADTGNHRLLEFRP